uniref:Odorant-binding protein n=1 Tax=Galeruca daurica TaxID=1651263 RepID=A0A1U9W520_9CUCU|nr:odorant-binding protein [Galeruca daurica]
MHISVFALFFVLAVVSAEITHEQIEAFKKIHEKCQSDPETKIDDAIYDKIKRGEKVTDPRLGKHTLCMNVGSGVQSQNGDINLDKLKQIVERASSNKERVDEIISKCGTRTSTNAEEAAVGLAECLMKFRSGSLHGEHHGHH